LGFLMPFSAAAISIFLTLIIILVLFDKSCYRQIYTNLKIPLYQSFILFLILHILGFLWLEVESINWHKSWMIWMIPILALAVDRETAKKGVYAYVIGMMFAEIYVYYNIFSIWEDYINGLYGDFLLPISHIAYNPFLAISVGLLLTTLLAGSYKNLRLVVAVFFLMTMIVNMFMTGGRAGQVGFIFIWLAISYYYLKRNISYLFIMIMALILILFTAWNFSPIFKERASRAFDELSSYDIDLSKKHNNTSIGLRIHYNKNSFNLFRESPLYGHGTGSFENSYKEYAKKSNNLVINTSNPHSNHLLILVQFGVLGLLIYINIFYQQVRAANLMPKNYEFRAMAFVLPFFFILISFYDSYLWGHHTQALFAYLTSIFYRTEMYQAQESVQK